MLKFIILLLMFIGLSYSFDAGEHGHIFESIAGIKKFKNAAFKIFNGAELVAFYGDFFSTCNVEHLICTAKDKQQAAKTLTEIGYNLGLGESKKTNIDTFLLNIRKLVDHEFKASNPEMKINKLMGLLTYISGDGNKVPSQGNEVWGSRGFNFKPKWSKIYSKPEICGQLLSLAMNNDHWSTCARDSGLELLKLGLTELSKANWKQGSEETNEFGWFAIMASLHFLSDQFAPGHVVTPSYTLRKMCHGGLLLSLGKILQVVKWGLRIDGKDDTGGFSANAIHDLGNNAGYLLTRTHDKKQWIGFGDHHFFLDINRETREAIVDMLMQIVLDVRNKKTSPVEIMKFIPRYMWDLKTLEINGCPYYYVPEDKTSIKETVKLEELLEPDRDFTRNVVWRLAYPNEKKQDDDHEKELIIDGTELKCRYLAPKDKLSLSKSTVCYHSWVHEVRCRGDGQNKEYKGHKFYESDGYIYPKCMVFSGKGNYGEYKFRRVNAPTDSNPFKPTQQYV
jgi:hypothetical protein